jgi:hypothetical protein
VRWLVLGHLLVGRNQFGYSATHRNTSETTAKAAGYPRRRAPRANGCLCPEHGNNYRDSLTSFCGVHYNNHTSSPFFVFAPAGRYILLGGRSPQTRHNYVLFLNCTTMRRQQAGAQSLLAGNFYRLVLSAPYYPTLIYNTQKPPTL